MPTNPPMRGREREVDVITALLRPGGVRLLTLTGLPGVGKTRLVEAAMDRRRSEDGAPVEWIDARGLDGPALRAALSDLAVRFPPTADAPAGRSSDDLPIVVIDGLDVASGAAEAVDDVLAEASVRLVVTRRVPLRVDGERVLRVEPFRRPPPHDPAAIAADPAVAIFCDVAAAVGQDVSSDAVPAVSAIVERLGGLPGAIEVVASRVVALSPDSILRLLTDGSARQVLASGGAREALPDAVAWSESLLDTEQQRLVRAMRVFVGPVPAEAVAAVASLDLGDAIDQLSELVDVHLVDADHSGTVSTFALHPVVREFAPPLDGAAEQEFADAHRRWALDLCAAADPSDVVDPDVVLVERDLMVVLERSIGEGAADAACRLVAVLAPLWQERGLRADEGGLLTATVAIADDRVDGGPRALVLGWSALFRTEAAALAGDVSGIARDRDTALALARSSDETTLLAVLRLAVQMAVILEDRDLAAVLCAEGVDLAGRRGAERSRTQFEIWSGMLAHQSRRIDDAAAIGADALARARRLGDADLIVTAAGLLLTLPRDAVAGIRLPSLGDLVGLAEEAGDRRQLLWLRPAAAAEALRSGQRVAAARLTADHLTATQSPAERSWSIISMMNVVGLALLEGDLETAARFEGVTSAHLPLIRRALPVQALGDHERNVTSLRIQLGEAAFAAAAGAGALVPLDSAGREALEYVRGVVERASHGRFLQSGSDEVALTAREREILDRLIAGDRNKQIAVRLGITPKTVMHHTSSIYRKLGVRGRGEAVAKTLGGRHPAA